jgi:hypothetical protein
MIASVVRRLRDMGRMETAQQVEDLRCIVCLGEGRDRFSGVGCLHCNGTGLDDRPMPDAMRETGTRWTSQPGADLQDGYHDTVEALRLDTRRRDGART